MQDLFRPTVIIILVLLIPILPFLGFGHFLEQWISDWAQSPPSRPITAIIVVGLLATDIFLPIPSSVISTLGGSQLHIIGGTAASALGMTVGSILGFAIARRWGRPIALRFANSQDLERMERVTEKYGPMVLVITRAVPVLAEAGVLLVGMNQLSWRRFLVPVILANLGVALAYSTLGKIAHDYHSLPIAISAAIVLPVLVTIIVRWRLATVVSKP